MRNKYVIKHLNNQKLDFKPKGAYIKVLLVRGQFEVRHLGIAALVLFWVLETACKCPVQDEQAEVELRLTQAEAVRLSFGCSLIN